MSKTQNKPNLTAESKDSQVITKTFPIVGMHCASCKALIEDVVSELEGVEEVYVNFGTEKMRVKYDSGEVSISDIQQAIENSGTYKLIVKDNDLILTTPVEVENACEEEEVDEVEKLQREEMEKLQKRVWLAGVGGVFMSLSMIWMLLARIDLIISPKSFLGEVVFSVNNTSVVWQVWNVIQFFIATPVLFIGGKDFFKSAFSALKMFKANMDTLISIGTFTAWMFSTVVTFYPNALGGLSGSGEVYFEASVFIVLFILIGRILERKAKSKANSAIKKLLQLRPDEATIIKDGEQIIVSVEQVKVGDTVIVKPGQKVPVDGKIVEGSSTIDESMITGESMPVEKSVGDEVIAGTINRTGSFQFKSTSVGSETLLAQIIQMVEDAQGSQVPIQRLADKISSIFVPIVILIALTAFLFWLLIAPGLGLILPGINNLQLATYIASSVLIIACPCALGLATPTAIVVGVGRAASKGILIRDGSGLELATDIDIIVFDKTGTITQGKPKVVDLHVHNLEENELLKVAASVENASEHPLAEAIVEEAKARNIGFSKVRKFNSITGKGVEGQVDMKNVIVGNEALMKSKDIDIDDFQKVITRYSSEGSSTMIVAVDGSVVGLIAVADKIKDESKLAITKLHEMGIDTAMLTGDNEKVANKIAVESGIDDYRASLLPGDKVEYIKELKNDSNYDVVAMVGDGVNDAPSLAQADVGIAIGTGSDIVIDSGDIVLIEGSLEKVVETIHLSQKVLRIIRQNLIWAFIYNVVGIPVAAGFLYPRFEILLSPIIGSMAMALSSLSVLTNSLRLRKK